MDDSLSIKVMIMSFNVYWVKGPHNGPSSKPILLFFRLVLQLQFLKKNVYLSPLQYLLSVKNLSNHQA
jgi:hypothetical protein